MKKWFIGVLSCLIISVVCVYIFLPTRVTVSLITTINASIKSTQRYLSDKPDRVKWWPGNDSINKAELKNNISTYKGYDFTIPHQLTNSTLLLISRNDKHINSSIIFIQHPIDTTLIQWQYIFEATLNPIKRVQYYLEARELKNTMADILKYFKDYMDKPKNIYNLKIERAKVKDTLLVATKKIFASNPDVAEVYDMITKLKNYIQNNGAKETNYPMLNVRRTDGKFEAMVAIPINKSVGETDVYVIKRMVLGNILVTQIKGGPGTVERAFKSFDYYISDYDFYVPAIPFELLITDRTKEADTTKWITRIYYPVR